MPDSSLLILNKFSTSLFNLMPAIPICVISSLLLFSLIIVSPFKVSAAPIIAAIGVFNSCDKEFKSVL